MNYIFIDTKSGNYGVLRSRKKATIATNGKLNKSTLDNLFGTDTKRRPKKITFVDERFIILPVSEVDKMHTDVTLIGKLLTRT